MLQDKKKSFRDELSKSSLNLMSFILHHLRYYWGGFYREVALLQIWHRAWHIEETCCRWHEIASLPTCSSEPRSSTALPPQVQPRARDISSRPTLSNHGPANSRLGVHYYLGCSIPTKYSRTEGLHSHSLVATSISPMLQAESALQG